jgi:hypothetical protein
LRNRLTAIAVEQARLKGPARCPRGARPQTPPSPLSRTGHDPRGASSAVPSEPLPAGTARGPPRSALADPRRRLGALQASRPSSPNILIATARPGRPTSSSAAPTAPWATALAAATSPAPTETSTDGSAPPATDAPSAAACAPTGLAQLVDQVPALQRAVSSPDQDHPDRHPRKATRLAAVPPRPLGANVRDRRATPHRRTALPASPDRRCQPRASRHRSASGNGCQRASRRTQMGQRDREWLFVRMGESASADEHASYRADAGRVGRERPFRVAATPTRSQRGARRASERLERGRTPSREAHTAQAEEGPP